MANASNIMYRSFLRQCPDHAYHSFCGTQENQRLPNIPTMQRFRPKNLLMHPANDWLTQWNSFDLDSLLHSHLWVTYRSTFWIWVLVYKKATVKTRTFKCSFHLPHSSQIFNVTDSHFLWLQKMDISSCLKEKVTGSLFISVNIGRT